MTKLEQILWVAMQILALMIVVPLILALGWALFTLVFDLFAGQVDL